MIFGSLQVAQGSRWFFSSQRRADTQCCGYRKIMVNRVYSKGGDNNAKKEKRLYGVCLFWSLWIFYRKK